MNEKIKRETKIINLPKNLILVNFFSAKSWLNRRVEEKKYLSMQSFDSAGKQTIYFSYVGSLTIENLPKGMILPP